MPELEATRDKAKTDAERAITATENVGQAIAQIARSRMPEQGDGYRHDDLRAPRGSKSPNGMSGSYARGANCSAPLPLQADYAWRGWSRVRFQSSGEGGIRTRGRLPFDGFQDRSIRPLWHLSASECIAPAVKMQVSRQQTEASTLSGDESTPADASAKIQAVRWGGGRVVEGARLLSV